MSLCIMHEDSIYVYAAYIPVVFCSDCQALLGPLVPLFIPVIPWLVGYPTIESLLQPVDCLLCV